MRLTASQRGAAYGLAAAFLFGSSTPLAKLFLAETGPLLLAGLLYLGGGVGLVLLATFTPRSWQAAAEAPIRRADLVPLLAIVVLGGVLGPVLMLTGLARVPAVTGALLLNLEGPLTMMLALLLFREHLGRTEIAASSLIFGGGLVLGFSGEVGGTLVGILALAAAALCWAADNNLTQHLSLRDPLRLALFKTCGAGLLTTVIALQMGEPLPAPAVVTAVMLVGAASYGVSLMLDIYALRLLGAAREAAYFATAPFIGALAAVPLLGERFGSQEIAAALLMAAGVALLARQRHRHEHVHEPLAHEHLHEHDEHHQHRHDGSEPAGLVHSHCHQHEALRHEHPHVSDVHHRHPH